MIARRVSWLDLKDINLWCSAADTSLHTVMSSLLTAIDELRRTGLRSANTAGPRPNMFGRTDVGMASQIAQKPECWPKPADIVLAGKNDLRLHNAAGEAELVPTLQHGTSKVLDIVNLLLHRDSCIASKDSSRSPKNF